MTDTKRHSFILLLSCLALIGFACNSVVHRSDQLSEQKSEVLTIAASSNMQFVMKDLSNTYMEFNKTKIELTFSSSGKLCSQIKAGAPYDLFISADDKYMENLIESEKIDSYQQFALGSLILMSSDTNIAPSLKNLNSDKVKTIALANPRNAPFGKAAIEVLKNLNLYNSIEHKLVYGESVSQVNNFIKLRTAQLAFTTKALAKSTVLDSTYKWSSINEELYSPIKISWAIVNKCKNHDEAMLLTGYIHSNTGYDALKKFGYKINE